MSKAYRFPHLWLLGVAALFLQCGKKVDDMAQVPLITGINTVEFSIDPYEAKITSGVASSRTAVDPEVNVDFATAKAACLAAGKRLCTTSEWRIACKGSFNHLFAFQATHDAPQVVKEVCDISRTENNTPGSLPSPTGAHPACKTEGLNLFDMIGNLSEWTVGPGDTAVASGVSFYQPEEESHCQSGLVDPGEGTISPATKSTDIGFRCCRDKLETTSDGGTGGGSSPVPNFPFD